ncbi:MAG: hypothetical protein E6K10_09000 [Methanobacteriota archaeon]|nr:MAG: hypothetical protein E6K10_09000 [Euryarchaeota archaeon]
MPRSECGGLSAALRMQVWRRPSSKTPTSFEEVPRIVASVHPDAAGASIRTRRPALAPGATGPVSGTRSPSVSGSGFDPVASRSVAVHGEVAVTSKVSVATPRFTTDNE